MINIVIRVSVVAQFSIAPPAITLTEDARQSHLATLYAGALNSYFNFLNGFGGWAVFVLRLDWNFFHTKVLILKSILSQLKQYYGEW